MSSGSPRVPFIAPDFPAADEVAHDYCAIVSANRFTNFGPYELELRSRLAAFVGPGAHAATFCNATLALQAAATALFRPAPQRDLVLMPAFTFAAAAHVVVARGLRPLFVDIETDGLHADPQLGSELIERHAGRVAGILFANAFGAGAHHVDEWEQLAEAHDLPLLIDSAAGFGSRYEDGTRLGLRGSCEAFSFHATKPFAIGEGGAVLTRDAELAERVRRISNFGFDADGEPVDVATNGKLAELPAAIGVRQLRRLADTIAERQEVFGRYRDALPSLHFPRNSGRASLAFVTVVLRDGARRDDVLARLRERGIEARRYYSPPLHRVPLFAAGEQVSLPRTESVVARAVSLPCHRGVDQDVVAEIADVLEPEVL